MTHAGENVADAGATAEDQGLIHRELGLFGKLAGGKTQFYTLRIVPEDSLIVNRKVENFLSHLVLALWAGFWGLHEGAEDAVLRRSKRLALPAGIPSGIAHGSKQ